MLLILIINLKTNQQGLHTGRQDNLCLEYIRQSSKYPAYWILLIAANPNSLDLAFWKLGEINNTLKCSPWPVTIGKL